MITYSVTIRHYTDPDYANVIGGGYSERDANRIADGASINLDHENYWIDVEPEDEPDEPEDDPRHDHDPGWRNH